MGGEGPAVRFSQDNTDISFWANRTGLKLLDSQQQEAVYSKAKGFFLERSSMLTQDGWQEVTTNTTVSFQIVSEPFSWTNKLKSILHLSNTRQSNLVLPASFLEASEVYKYEKMFRIFSAKRDRMNNLFINSNTPLADIFYLLQTLLPGMLLIYRIDDYDEIGDEERIRALPPAAWVEEHKGWLQTIFEDHTERYGRLLVAAGDRQLGEMIKTYHDDVFDIESDSGFYANRFGHRGERFHSL